MYTDFGLKIKHLHNLITKKTYALFSNDKYLYISHSGFLVLDYLYENRKHQVTQKDVEKTLVINRATTSKMLLLLEQKGFISRVSNSEDARSKLVFLTKDGMDFHRHSLNEAERLDRFFSDVLLKEDFDAFDRLYEKLRKALEK